VYDPKSHNTHQTTQTTQTTQTSAHIYTHTHAYLLTLHTHTRAYIHTFTTPATFFHCGTFLLAQNITAFLSFKSYKAHTHTTQTHTRCFLACVCSIQSQHRRGYINTNTKNTHKQNKHTLSFHFLFPYVCVRVFAGCNRHSAPLFTPPNDLLRARVCGGV